MSENDRQRVINPYQPPPIGETVHGEFAHLGVNLDLDDKPPLPFSGEPTAGDLNQFLNSHDSIGPLPAATIAIFLVLLQLWAILTSAAVALTVAGGLVIAVIVVVTSSRWYRSLVFRSMHPTWCELVEGELSSDGVRIQRFHESAFYRWSWFAGVVIADSMVAFVPAQESEAPILISSGMLPESETCSRG